MAKDPPYRVKNMMPGMIMLWAGSVATIPSGWHLCDGTVGTPDLQDVCIVGSRDGMPGPSPGQTGGSKTHFHPFTGDGHAHDLAVGNAVKDDTPIGDLAHATDVSPASGDTNVADSRQPWHSLCYIMKL